MVSRRKLHTVLTSAYLLLGVALVAATLAVPALLLLHVNNVTLNRWAEIGQALSSVGVFFSGIAFIGIAITLVIQRRELENQRDELGILSYLAFGPKCHLVLPKRRKTTTAT